MSNLKKLIRKRNRDLAGKMIGYFAIRTGTKDIICDGDACVIAGKRKNLEHFIIDLVNDAPEKYTIKRTTLGEIYKGMKMGAAYAFDPEAYDKFSPFARRAGIPTAERYDDSPKPHDKAVRLTKIQWVK